VGGTQQHGAGRRSDEANDRAADDEEGSDEGDREDVGSLAGAGGRWKEGRFGCSNDTNSAAAAAAFDGDAGADDSGGEEWEDGDPAAAAGAEDRASAEGRARPEARPSGGGGRPPDDGGISDNDDGNGNDNCGWSGAGQQAWASSWALEIEVPIGLPACCGGLSGDKHGDGGLGDDGDEDDDDAGVFTAAAPRVAPAARAAVAEGAAVAAAKHVPRLGKWRAAVAVALAGDPSGHAYLGASMARAGLLQPSPATRDHGGGGGYGDDDTGTAAAVVYLRGLSQRLALASDRLEEALRRATAVLAW
jgi:hypothetical protein